MCVEDSQPRPWHRCGRQRSRRITGLGENRIDQPGNGAVVAGLARCVADGRLVQLVGHRDRVMTVVVCFCVAPEAAPQHQSQRCDKRNRKPAPATAPQIGHTMHPSELFE